MGFMLGYYKAKQVQNRSCTNVHKLESNGQGKGEFTGVQMMGHDKRMRLISKKMN